MAVTSSFLLGNNTEHIWAKIIEVEGRSLIERLLANDPVDPKYNFGDKVSLTTGAVEEYKQYAKEVYR